MKIIQNNEPLFEGADWDRVTANAKDFCRSLMQKNPKDRLNGQAAIKHPWIQTLSTLHQVTRGTDLNADTTTA